jgi:hypothetical protein
MVEYEPRLHEVAEVIRKQIHLDCMCKECERLRLLLDYLAGVEFRLPELI